MVRIEVMQLGRVEKKGIFLSHVVKTKSDLELGHLFTQF